MSFLRKQETKLVPAELVPAEAGSGYRNDETEQE